VTVRSQSLVGTQKEKPSHCGLYHQHWATPCHSQGRLFSMHDVIVNETPKFQSLNHTNLSHSISIIGDNVEDVLVITLELHDVVSCFPTFKPTQMEFGSCDRYEFTYESPDYDPSTKNFHDQ
jgi:hypothetical protein